jgi:BirA family biotin operon repressor/biotin-[acetyl-CoA-carboxylase] ligase
MLLAGRQSAGRGRLGRTWVQAEDLGLAVTFALDASTYPPERLSLAAGVAACRALEGNGTPFERFGLKWPNDVVEPGPRPGGGRKIGGVLVEVRDGLALVGVGLNLNQRREDFPPELRDRAVSLLELATPPAGPRWRRIDVARALLSALHRALALEPRHLRRRWLERDVLVGSAQVFRQGNREVRGIVESIKPSAEIVVRTGPGTVVRLPALTTSLVKP